MKKTFSALFSWTLLATLLMVTGACNNKKFQVNGVITDAKDSILYFENMSLDGPVTVDSVKLTEKGDFSFSEKAPNAPDFYRLRIAGQIINISVDSTETITVKASYPTMATNYTVEGSAECNTIKDLALKQIELQQRIMAIQNNTSLGYDKTNDSINSTVEAYKDFIKRNYIFKAPMKASSYFALFQTLGNTLIFNPKQSEDDVKVFAAVATSWDTYYPNALRGQNLHNIAIEGMKNVRIMRNKIAEQQIDANRVNVANLINITLTDNKGVQRSLTDLKGKVVMLDFHVFGTKESTARIMKLRELYNKYHAQGFEIYQIALNSDEHFWKTQTAAIPWISVRDPEGINSGNLAAYNVQSIPTFFLINRNNELQKRDVQISDVDAEINKLLHQ